MKRLTLLVVGLALLGGVAAGCSKTDDVTTPAVNGANVDANKIANDANKCADLGTAWANAQTGLATLATSDAKKADVQKALDDMKSKVPDANKADVDALSNGIKNAKTQMDVATFLGTPEYTKATTNLTNYITKDCAKVGS